MRASTAMIVAWMVCVYCVVTPARGSGAASGGYSSLVLQMGGGRAIKACGAGAQATLRLRGGAAAARPGGLFAASVSRWQHDDIMQVIFYCIVCMCIYACICIHEICIPVGCVAHTY